MAGGVVPRLRPGPHTTLALHCRSPVSKYFDSMPLVGLPQSRQITRLPERAPDPGFGGRHIGGALVTHWVLSSGGIFHVWLITFWLGP
jgi:hypothetical protein